MSINAASRTMGSVYFKAAASELARGQERRAYSLFSAACKFLPKSRVDVYRALWEVMGKPTHHLDFGRAAFHGRDQQSAPNNKKIDAIVMHLSSMHERALLESIRLFRNNQEEEALQEFAVVKVISPATEHTIYGKLWAMMKNPDHVEYGRLAFNAVAGASLRVQACEALLMQAAHCLLIKALNELRESPKTERVPSLVTFEEYAKTIRVFKKLEQKIHHALWELMDKPMHHPDFGRAAFHERDGQSAPLPKKIKVIVAFCCMLDQEERDATAYASDVLNKLQSIIDKLVRGSQKEAIDEFETLPLSVQHEAFRQLWKLAGKPFYPDFGRWAFYNSSSRPVAPLYMKAIAIELYLDDQTNARTLFRRSVPRPKQQKIDNWCGKGIAQSINRVGDTIGRRVFPCIYPKSFNDEDPKIAVPRALIYVTVGGAVCYAAYRFFKSRPNTPAPVGISMPGHVTVGQRQIRAASQASISIKQAIEDQVSLPVRREQINPELQEPENLKEALEMRTDASFFKRLVKWLDGPLFGWSKKQEEYLKIFDEWKENPIIHIICKKRGKEHNRFFRYLKDIVMDRNWKALDELIGVVNNLIQKNELTKSKMDYIMGEVRWWMAIRRWNLDPAEIAKK